MRLSLFALANQKNCPESALELLVGSVWVSLVVSIICAHLRLLWPSSILLQYCAPLTPYQLHAVRPCVELESSSANHQSVTPVSVPGKVPVPRFKRTTQTGVEETPAQVGPFNPKHPCSVLTEQLEDSYECVSDFYVS